MWEHKNSLMFPDKQSDPVALLNDGLGTSGAQPASGGVRSQGYRNIFFLEDKRVLQYLQFQMLEYMG